MLLAPDLHRAGGRWKKMRDYKYWDAGLMTVADVTALLCVSRSFVYAEMARDGFNQSLVF